MAKPHLNPNNLPHRPPHRRPRRLARSRRSGPSSTLLSLLATIAASSSTVDGTPLITHRSPPPFLCPSLQFEGDVPPDAVLIYRPQNPSPNSPAPSPPQSDKRNIPDKYTQGPDGRWRKAEYTLYGSTICQLPGSAAPTPVIDEASPPSSHMPLPTSSPSQFIDTLPNGWEPRHKPASAHTTLILGLSLGLAFFICFLIMGCIFWRKNKGRQKDEEEKVQKRRREELRDDRENLVEKEARVKQKIWARATARWKSHARYSAQQRRGKRTGHRLVQAQSSSISFGDPQTLSEGVSSRPSSPYPPVSLREASVLPWVPSLHANHSVSLPEISTLQTLSPYSPPAYHSQGARLPSVATDPSHGSSSNPSPSASYRFRRSSLSMTHNPRRSSSSIEDLPYVPPYDDAHVAVDDKGILARLADLASAPPLDDGNASRTTDTSDTQVSAPEWHDEELDDFGESSRRSSLRPISTYRAHPSALPFPPPPLFKGKLNATALYEYSFEDLTSQHKPSPPSFEGSFPSAPPLEDTDMLPSAPPLADAECVGTGEDFEHHDNPIVQQPDLSEDIIRSVQGPNRIPPCYYP